MQTFVQLIADGAVFPVIAIGAYALIAKVPSKHRYAAYCRILMAGLTTYLLAKLLGAVYQPAIERPFELMGVAPGAAYLDNPGFPSDHTLFVAAILFAVWFETRNKWLTGSVAFFVVLVCVGRVAALVHTPLDIAGGLLVAMIGAGWYFTNPELITRLKRKKRQSL